MTEPASFRILLDECVQAGALQALVADGHHVVRPAKAGTTDSPSDDLVLDLAAAEGRVLVTTDVDLLEVQERWISEGKEHAGIILGQQDQNLKRFLRNLRYTLLQYRPEDLRGQLVWIRKAE